jgi:hypothetical protein
METTLLWPLFFSHRRRIRANIIRRPKATTRSIPFPEKTLSSTGTLKHPDWPCYLHSWQTQARALRAICPAGRRSPRGTLTESWMGQALPPSKPRVRAICFLPQMDSSRNDVGRLLWHSGDSDDASLNPALNAAMLLTRYAWVIPTKTPLMAAAGFERLNPQAPKGPALCPVYPDIRNLVVYPT